jgi:exonuclease VII small subunit
MKIAQRHLTLFVSLLAFLPLAHAASQAELARDCDAEIERVERRIADARKKPEYRTERGRQALTSADRSLNQARQHAAKGEPRNCITAAQKARTQALGH